MKRAITVLVLAMAVLTLAQTQKKGMTPGTDAASKALIDLEEKWVAALEKSDAATLDTILADTYVDTDEESHRSDKQAVLAVVKSGDLKMTSVKISDMQVHIYGDAAVVTGSAAQTGNFKGQQLKGKITFTDTFIRRNGKWTAVASQRSPVV